MHPQRSFADVEYDGQPRQTRRERFLRRMEALMPWARLEARIRPVYPTGERGRPPYPLALLLRIHCVQLFYNLSDPAMEDALYDSVAVQRFVGLTARGPRPDETTILHFRVVVELHGLSFRKPRSTNAPWAVASCCSKSTRSAARFRRHAMWDQPPATLGRAVEPAR